MNKRKTVLTGLAIFAGLAVVYIFLSSGGSGRGPSPVPQAKADSPSANAGAVPPGRPADAADPADTGNQLLHRPEMDKPVAAQSASQDKGLLGTAAELVLYLVLISVLVVGLLVFLKKILPGGHRIFDSQAIEVIGKAHLAPKQAIYLAKIGPRVLVLGVAEQSINVLTEISDADEINGLKARMAQGKVDSVTGAFMSIFKRKGAEFASEADKNDKGVQEGLGKIRSLVDKWHKNYATRQV
jgi:flagellar biogenesis protein FliO